MRRTGKTTLLRQHLDYLRSLGTPEDSICHIDVDLIGGGVDSKQLKDLIQPCLDHEGTHYILLDEIQDVERWELVVAMLIARRDCDVYITGSNSKMLSSELSTKLSGRYRKRGCRLSRPIRRRVLYSAYEGCSFPDIGKIGQTERHQQIPVLQYQKHHQR